jgi:hypothetical protein
MKARYVHLIFIIRTKPAGTSCEQEHRQHEYDEKIFHGVIILSFPLHPRVPGCEKTYFQADQREPASANITITATGTASAPRTNMTFVTSLFAEIAPRIPDTKAIPPQKNNFAMKQARTDRMQIVPQTTENRSRAVAVLLRGELTVSSCRELLIDWKMQYGRFHRRAG